MARLPLSYEENGTFRHNGYPHIVGKSSAMQHIFHMIDNLGQVDSTVLIQGESGTGKELVAAALHYHGPRCNGPFIKVNCSALPENLLESELFGHVKGAFTGAISDRKGRFQVADGGTILLDEIGDMPRGLQVRLLRVLQEKEFERVGDTKTIKVDVRVIAATNRRLHNLVQKGIFREDLFYRLNVVCIDIPPLRERAGDIPILIDHFKDKLNAKLNRNIQGLDPQVVEAMLRYPWPGNIRELENIIERTFILAKEPIITFNDLPQEIVGKSLACNKKGTIKAKLEPKNLLAILEETGWNKSRAARRLGVNRTTIWRKIKQFNLVESTS
jgi:two-component system response regulator HydG